jgi:hypothetical protein
MAHTIPQANTIPTPCPNGPAIVGKCPSSQDSDCTLWAPLLGGVFFGFVLAVVMAVVGTWLIDRQSRMQPASLDFDDIDSI